MGDKNFVQDYTLVCRTCLQSNVEMLSLSAYINDNVQEENSKISYMECLKMCIQVEENIKDLPVKICLECASALQVAYWFMKNATQAQELLKMKLKEIRLKKQQIEKEISSEELKKPKRYRCKICNVKVETKRSLKDHVKLHLDIIVYNCQLCSFESHNRNNLSDHYIEVHGVEATKEQLKPKTKSPATTSSTSSNITTTSKKNDKCLMVAMNTESSFKVLPESTQTSYETHNIPTSSSSLQMTSVAATMNHTALTTAAFTPLEGDLAHNVNSDLNLANEFIVMADGSVEKVIGKDVVIEYINATDDGHLCLDNSLVLDNIIQVQNIGNNDILQNHQQNDIIQMDVDDIIIEDTGESPEEVNECIPLPLEEEKIPATIIEQRKKILCKICNKDFATQEKLKNHMLTHNEIPHFFCDQCKFYTFFKIDLHQHYKSKHNLQPTSKQLQPKNKQKSVKEVYSCDLCFYQSDFKIDLKIHYMNKHNVETSDIHLKPTIVEKNNAGPSSSLSVKAKTPGRVSPLLTATTATSKNVKIQPIEQTSPDYPNGLNCRKCHEVFYWRNKLYEHYKLHNAEEAALKQEKQFEKVQQKQTTSNQYQNKIKKSKIQTQTQMIISQPHVDSTNTTTFSNLNILALNVISNNNALSSSSIAPLTPSSSSTYTLPSDAIPQIVETDQTIENDMEFDFNGDDDALFQDFDDDVDVENDSDDNDSEFRNVLLTSDDDFEDMLQEQNNLQNRTAVTANESYCVHCQKGFLSQYQFENHMFVHRGLAPYRCEMCTNLYNKKRCLIRHYKAVHKSVPTRDMIQAKGDKVYIEKGPMDSLNLQEINSALMCAKCPYESLDLNEMLSHLKSSHNITDDTYIMKKLPFECTRCIRSFANKVKLLRHLERNHSSTPINQHQIRFDTVVVDNVSSVAASAIATSSTSSTSFITTGATTVNSHINMMMNSETSETNASCGYSMFCTKQEDEQQQQQQYINTSSKRNELTIEDAVAPNIIIPDLKDSNTTSATTTNSTTTSLDCNETSDNSYFVHSFNDELHAIDATSSKIKASNSDSLPSALDQNGSVQPLFKCKLCHFTCYNIQSFNEHSKRIDCRKFSVNCPDDRMLFECEICHCNYKTMYLLKHHLKRHIGRKFFCVNCPKTFISKMELEAHKRVHSGERPHKCDACPKSFRYVHHLKRHKDSVHFGKRHACTEPNCGRKFTTLAQLKVHIWTHNGIVPYKCKFCERLFKKRLLLREHCLKAHKINLSEEEMAEIFRNSLGYTNPHDFTVTIGNGKMLRRGDLETMGASGVIKSEFK